MNDWLDVDDGRGRDDDPTPRRTLRALEIQLDELKARRPKAPRATNAELAAHDRECQRLVLLMRQVAVRADRYDNPLPRLHHDLNDGPWRQEIQTRTFE